MTRLIIIFTALLGSAIALFAQSEQPNNDTTENSGIVRMLEDTLSTENRQIRLSGIEGLLASNARVAEITIADPNGVWLRIKDAEIEWSRLALLTGRLKIDSLSARSIAFDRLPEPDRNLPSLEAEPFSLPDLPVSVEIGDLDVAALTLGQPVLGHAATLKLAGNMFLVDGALDTDLNLTRLGLPGGQFRVKGSYDPEDRNVAVDLRLIEPAGGIVSALARIRGRPGLELTVSGNGPVDDLEVDLRLATDGEERIVGRLDLAGNDNGLSFDGRLGGQLDLLTAAEFEPFFGGDSILRVQGRNRAEGGIDVDNFLIRTAALRMDGALATTSDGFLKSLRADGRLGDGETQIILPVAGGDTSLRSAVLALDYGQNDDDAWTGALEFRNLIGGDITVGMLSLDLSGIAKDIDQADKRRLTVSTRGRATGLKGASPDLTRALGRELTLDIDAEWRAGAPVQLPRANISGNGIAIDASGALEDYGFDGILSAKIARLRPFAGLLGRDLGGSVDLQLVGKLQPLLGSFDFSARGQSDGLRIGSTVLDPLLQGRSTIQGQVIRNETGLRTRNLSLRNPQVRITSDGVISSRFADLEFKAELSDLALLSKQARGAVRLDGQAKGNNGIIRLQSRIGVAEGALMARDLTGFSAGFAAELKEGQLTGRISGQGRLGDDTIVLSGDADLNNGDQTIRNLDFRVGPSQILGHLERAATGLIDGNVTVRSPDISGISALFLQDATGRIDATLGLAATPTGQQISTKATLGDITYGGANISTAKIDAVAYDAFNVPGIVGGINFGETLVAGLNLTGGKISATVDGDTTNFSADAGLSNGAAFDANGTLTRISEGFSLALTRLSLQQDQAIATLAGPAALTLTNGEIREASLALRIGDGRITIAGNAGETVDLDLALAAVPLSFANAVYPNMGADGSLNGSARIFGARSNPDITFAITGNALTTDQVRAADLPPINLSVTGEGTGEQVTIDGRIDGPQNFSADISGDIPILATTREMNLTGTLQRLPLELIDAIAGRPGLRGRIAGEFGITGRTTQPRIRFEMQGAGISASATRTNGVPALDMTAVGSFFNDTIVLSDARIGGAGGIDFRGNGRIPIRLDGLQVGGNGTLPLSIANVPMAAAGLRASGVTNLSVDATGRLSAPVLSGRMSLNGGTFVAPLINLRLEDLQFDGTFSGNRFNLQRASARNSRGGTAEMSGYVEIDALRNFPTDLTIYVDDLSHTDGRSFATVLNSDLTLKGPLTRQATLAGQINIGKTEITIPEREPKAKTGFALNIDHRNAPAPVSRTLSRAGYDAAQSERGQSASQLRFEIDINAPNQIFVRGRGLDGEMGGKMRLLGTPQSPSPVGSFDLIRGRMNVLGRRVELTSGQIAFTGDLSANLALRARTVVDDIEATISLDGPVLKPVLGFSSVPDLPDDEILSRIIFGRSVTELSPLQIARLASAIADLSGRSGLSFFDDVRRATGLDDLDFQTNDEGSTTLRVGKYIRDNVYSSIEADDRGNSKISVNLDINSRLKAKGTVDSAGNTSVGVFFERDY